MSERYECNLSAELLQKAHTELNEPTDNSVRLAAIDQLRTRFQENSDLDLMRSDDTFILRFLRVKKFDQDRAYQCLINYHKQRNEHANIFDKINNPKLLSDLLETVPALSLGQKAKDKSFVVVGRPGHGFKESHDLVNFFASVLLIVENLLENESFQICGLTVIQDLSSFSFSYAVHMPTYGKQFFSIVQDAMPIRVKSVNIINKGFVFGVLFSVLRSTMKPKTKKRLQALGSDHTELYKIVPKEHLPGFIGGDGPEIDPEKYKQELLGEC